MEPVDPDLNPDYYDMVAQPLALSDIAANLQEGVYVDRPTKVGRNSKHCIRHPSAQQLANLPTYQPTYPSINPLNHLTYPPTHLPTYTQGATEPTEGEGVIRFADDVRQIFANCRCYNSEGSQLGQ